MPSIEVEPTALVWPMTLAFNALRAMVMTYSNAKVNGQSVLETEWKQTDGQMDGRTDEGDCITSLTNAVGKNIIKCMKQ